MRSAAEVDAAGDQRPAGAQAVQDEFVDAWLHGQPDRVLASLASDATITLHPAAADRLDEAGLRSFLQRVLPLVVPTKVSLDQAGKVSVVLLDLVPEMAAAPPVAAGDAASASETQQERRSLPGVAGQIARMLGIATAVLVAIAAAEPLLGMLYTIRPDLRPEGPPVVRGVTLADPMLEERGVVCYDGAACNRIGYDVEFQGYQRDRIEIAWAAFDPATLQRVDLGVRGAPPPGEDMIASIAVAEAASDRASQVIDVPLPRAGQCIFVRISIYEGIARTETGAPGERGTRLDVADTRPFHTHDPTASCGPVENSAESP